MKLSHYFELILPALSCIVFSGCETDRTPARAPTPPSLSDLHQVDVKEKTPAPRDRASPGSVFNSTMQRAEAGDVQAQLTLAQMYDDGKGVEQSDVEAFKWWMKAAKQGIPVAQHNVGVAYLVGIGVAKHQAEALRWFSLAAQNGNFKSRQYAERLKAGENASQMIVARGPPANVRPPVQRTQPNRPRITPRYIPRLTVDLDYTGVGGGHWVEHVMDDGSIVKLEDGSLWQVSPLDVIYTAFWLPVSDITVIRGDDGAYPFKLINKDDGEVVNARLIAE